MKALSLFIWSVLAATVAATTPPPLKSGTGFVITNDGFVLTYNHVVDGCSAVRVFALGKTHDGTVVGSDRQTDLAVVKVSGLPAPSRAAFRDNVRLKLGERAIAAGYPLQGVIGSSLNVTTGTISALSGLADDTRMMQFTAPIQPGNSGGPLFDGSGNVIGMVTSKLSYALAAKNIGDIPQNVNFAIKQSVMRDFLDGKGIDYETRASNQVLDATVVGEQAQKTVVNVECTSVPDSLPATSVDASVYPIRWKSLSSGIVRKFRFEGDFIYAENVLTEEQLGFVNYELKKDNSGSYKGVIRAVRTCSYPSAWNNSSSFNECRFEGPIEFNSVTPIRIEGRVMSVPNGAKFDCKKCAYSEPFVWKPLTLIPEIE